MALTIVQAPADHCWSKNIIPLNIETDLPYGAYVDIDIFVSAFIYGSGTWTLLATQRLYFDSLGRAELDMQSIFDASFDRYGKPALDLLGIQNIYDKINLAKYEIAEFEADGTAGDTYSAEFDLYRGGIPREFEKSGATPEWLIDNKKWLTWKPLVTVVSKRQPEVLAFKLPLDNSVANFIARFSVYFDSGNSYDVDQSYPPSGVSAFDIYFLCAGYDANDLGLLEPGSNPLYYTVTLIDQDTSDILCETRKYIIDPIDRPYERFFYFSNSLMGFDTLRTIGLTSMKVSLTDIDADITPPVSFGIIIAPIQRMETIEQPVRLVNTGFKSKEEIDWLRDLRLSRDVYELDLEDLETFIPIILTKNELLPGKDNEDVYALQFEYRRAYYNSTYAAVAVR